MKLYPILLMLLISSGYLIHSQSFKIGIAVEGDNVALGQRLVSLIAEQSRSLREHQLSDDELAAYNVKMEEIKRSSILLDLVENRLKADRERFNEQRRGKTMANYKREQKKLQKQLRKITITPPPLLWPIVWDKTFYQALTERLLLSEQEMILWLHGSVTELRSGLIYIDFYSTNSLTGHKEQLYSKSIKSNELESAANEIMLKAASTILGRQWASVTLEGNSKNSTILLNNQKITSLLDLQYLSTGDYTIEIQKPGYQPFKQDYRLNHTDRVVINYAPIFDSNQIAYYITSEPSGAQVSLDGDYIGLTPLSIQAGNNQIITLFKESYQSTNYLLGSNYDLFFTLLHNDFIPKRSREEQWFHATYSIFIVSLALPIIFFTLRSNALNLAAANSGQNQAESLRWQKKASTYGYVGAATSGLSAVFLGVSLSRLYYYIKLKDQSPPQNKNKK